jgi:uncharacterized damage-inducible protein DinB
MDNFLRNALHEFKRHKGLADRAIAQLSDDEFVWRPATHVNSVAVIVKHLAGNLQSRWTDFLTPDGEKAYRNRDGEFQLTQEDTRSELIAAWNRGWAALFDSVESLSRSDLARSITIRGETLTVLQALLRAMSHAAYHVGQILYLVRLLQPNSVWLTIAPGQSSSRQGTYMEDV